MFSCGYRAYFNTYYNAKKYYNTALKMRREAALAGRDTLLVGIIELDSAIIRCGKIVKYYSSSPFVDDALFMMGNSFLLKGEYQLAIKKFEEIYQYYPASPFTPRAYLNSGVAYTLKGEYEIALGQFVKAYMTEDKGVMPEALFNEIKVYVLSEEYNIALSKIGEFKEKFTRSSFYILVLLEESEIYFQNEDWINLLDLQEEIHEVVDEKNFSLYLKTNLRFAQALRYLGRLDEAIDVLRALRAKMGPGTKDAEVAIEIAHCLREKNNFQEALSICDEIVKTYPRTTEAAKALYLAGEIYEENLSDFKKAKEFFDESRMSNPDDITAAMAMRRAASLDRIFIYESQVETMSFQGRDTIEFLLAELYTFELKNTVLGEQKLLQVIDNYSESEYYPKALLLYANILGDKGENVKADSIFRLVIELFPSTEYSQYAYNKLLYADTSTTQEE
ncbi:tetratricopeptide repeat protein [candidate division WOR-3 bacterium]|nr:tetratricopeptide repeat protein [candidate division WOR-3 bacterium]